MAQARIAARKQHFKLIATLHKQRGVPVLFNTKTNWDPTEQFVQQLAGDHYTYDLLELARQA